MNTLRNLLFTLILSLPTYLIAQDTLIAQILIVRTPQGIEISYGKDLRYTDEQIATFLLQVLKPEAIKPKEPQHEEEKYKKI